jgi:hypothetical protein
MLTIVELRMDTRDNDDDDDTGKLDRSQQQQLQRITPRQSRTLILHPSVLSKSHIFGNILAPGTRVQVSGHVQDESGINDAESILWVSQIRLLQAAWNPSTIQYMMELMAQNLLKSDEISEALNLSQSDIKDGVFRKDKTTRQWKACEIASDLQANSQILKASVSPETNRVLDLYKDLRSKYPIQETHFYPAERYDRDPLRDGSRWSQKKEPQLAWMTHEIEQVVQSHPDYGQRTLVILDVGGGKGLLANNISQKLGKLVDIIVIDVAREAIKNGAMTSRRLNLSVEYMVTDASEIVLQRKIDVVVALRKYMDCTAHGKEIF